MKFLASTLGRLRKQPRLGEDSSDRIEIFPSDGGSPSLVSRNLTTDSDPRPENGLSIERQRDWTVVDLGGSGPDSLVVTRALGVRLIRLIDQERPAKLHIDLSRVNQLTSETLNQLIQVNCHARSNGTQLVLGNLSETLQEVFRVTRLDRLFELTAVDPDSDR
ncbi:MAG: anti-sigma factor antagonist [Planctomycetaceae bacterium]|nr:MAG: anti-sigma factor antagonist [Planctomycetaceae bacterium]